MFALFRQLKISPSSAGAIWILRVGISPNTLFSSLYLAFHLNKKNVLTVQCMHCTPHWCLFSRVIFVTCHSDQLPTTSKIFHFTSYVHTNFVCKRFGFSYFSFLAQICNFACIHSSVNVLRTRVQSSYASLIIPMPFSWLRPHFSFCFLPTMTWKLWISSK